MGQLFFIPELSVGAGGDVVGPASATDNAVARFDGITGKLIQNSVMIVDDAGNTTTPGTVNGRNIAVDGAKLDTIETGADVTDFANVSTALGGAAGANVGWIFKSDGLGSGTMQPNTASIARSITVGLSGDVDYTSVATAVAAAVLGGAGAATPWQVLVYPGTYIESPFTLPPGVVITSVNGEGENLVILVAANPLVDFITHTGGALIGATILGVTDPAAALIRMATPGVPGVLIKVNIGACSNGLIVESGAIGIVIRCTTAVVTPAAGIGTAFTVTDAGSQLLLQQLAATVPTAILPAYPGVNPIETTVSVTSGALAQILTSSIIVAANTATQAGVYVDDSAFVDLQTTTFADNATAVRIGTVGTSSASLLACALSNNTINLESLSAVGEFRGYLSVDDQKFSFVAGTTFSGSVLNAATDHFDAFALTGVYPDTFTELDILDWFFKFSSSASWDGGTLSDGGGLNVDIAAGTGVIKRSVDSDAYSVSWAGATILLPASVTRFISYNSTTDTLIATAGAPGNADILLGVVVTGGAAIRYIHNTNWTSSSLAKKIRDYFYTTRRVIAISGLAGQVGSGPTKITVDPGSYYLSFEIISYAGAVDATFNAFYGTDGATELSAQTDVNTTDYDNAGVLTAMTAGFFRSDTLYLTSDGRLSLLFGTAEFATQLAAEGELPALPTTFLEQSAIAIASLIVEEGVGIASVLDRRPFGEPAGGSTGGGGVSDHGALTGLTDDDHLQYLLVDGTRAMSGALDMGAQNITNVGLVDGVDVPAHAARHLPGGADALTTGAPSNLLVGGGNVTGVAASFARADHLHGITRGTPVTIGTANAAGVSSDFAGADHVHAHGNLAGGSLHDLVVPAGAAGFMSGADKTKLDGLPSVVPSAILLWGSNDVTRSTTTRYLFPSYTNDTAFTTPVQWRSPRAGTLQNLRVRHNTTAGNGNAIVYTVRVNGIASALTVSLASTSSDGSDLVNTVAVAAGDLLDIEVTKALDITSSPSNIMASLECT